MEAPDFGTVKDGSGTMNMRTRAIVRKEAADTRVRANNQLEELSSAVRSVPLFSTATLVPFGDFSASSSSVQFCHHGIISWKHMQRFGRNVTLKPRYRSCT
jgi:hypothetical protein